jgi:hypothetical protein
MPAERVSMRRIREALRLTHALGMSRRLVGEATEIGKTAVGEYVRRAAVAGLSWPIPDEIDDAELERRLLPRGSTIGASKDLDRSLSRPRNIGRDAQSDRVPAWTPRNLILGAAARASLRTAKTGSNFLRNFRRLNRRLIRLSSLRHLAKSLI